MTTITYTFEENIQRAILYLCKSSEDFLVQVVTMVKPEYFELGAHQKIYELTRNHWHEYKELITDSQLVEEFKAVKAEKETLGEFRSEIKFVNALDVQSFSDTEYYINKVEDFAKKESMTQAVLESVEDINNGRLEIVVNRVRDALNVGRQVDLGSNYFEGLQSRYNEEDEGDCEFGTVFPTLDETLGGGGSTGEVYLVVAPPGVGKSVYLANQAVRSAKQGHNVLFISLEMDRKKVEKRVDSIMTRIPMAELKFRVPEIEDRLKKVKERYPDMGEIKSRQFPTRGCSVAQLRAFITQVENYEGFKPDVIIVDYLDIMSSDMLSKYDAQQDIVELLRGLAVEKDVHIWTATQTNREAKKVNVITDAELADCYGKIRVVDLAISLNQTEEEKANGLMRIFVMKSRNGPAHMIIPVRHDVGRLILFE